MVKVGGEELAEGPALAELVTSIALILRSGRPVVIVHGGGDEVTERAAELGIASEQRDGLRVTTDRMLGVVAEVLAGRINVRLVNALTGAGVPAVGLTGVSAALLPVRPAGSPPGSLGWVGEPIGARTRLLNSLLSEGYTPVVAPLGVDGSGAIYNVNADQAAAAVAGAMKADLLLITDVDAVRDAQGDPVRALALPELLAFLEGGAAKGGMIPKLQSAARALREGSPSVWIGSLHGLRADGPLPYAGTRLTLRRAAAASSTLLPPMVPGGR
ncbi:MAG: acetylglutamate kinase [Thermoplasmata archaeon]|nr:acetylglutamate kinase [Thermoplasmata archaeon]